MTVEVSSNGGADFTELETLVIRFRVSSYYGASDEYFFADNVQIEAQ